MKRLQRIIVGIDVFAKSNNVLKRALMVAKQNKADLFIVHAVQSSWLSIPNYFGGKKVTVDIKSIKKKIDKKIKVLNKECKVSYTILVKEGDADDILLYESKLLKADMLIVGSNTFTGYNSRESSTTESFTCFNCQELCKRSIPKGFSTNRFSNTIETEYSLCKKYFPRYKDQSCSYL